ncbi:hypothetical protein NC652_030263 [Populus alba x Populus x berolinensis]|nr:hypothetical protein NC652_030263 [Populus alba x Populus x berolinensis]
MAPLAAISNDLSETEKQNEGPKPDILLRFCKPFLPFLRLQKPAITRSRKFTRYHAGLFLVDRTHFTIDWINTIPFCSHLLNYKILFFFSLVF